MDGPGPSDPPPERPPRTGVFEPVALTDDHPRLARWVVVAVLALAVVIVKPWDVGGERAGAPDDRGPDGTVAAAPSGTGHPTAVPRPAQAETLVDDFCIDRGQWLVVSIERRRDQTFRVWRALDPTPTAAGPEDPAIPLLPVVSDGVLDLGWCAPTYGPERPSGDASIDAWRIGIAGAAPLAMTPGRADEATSPFGALYAAPRRPLSSRSATWPDGRYVFRDRAEDGAERWFSIEVVNRAAVVPVS
jgi:hypothetical protein